MVIETIKSIFKNIPVPEPKVPVGQFIDISSDDVEQEEVPDVSFDSLSSALFIFYKNAKGDLSKRRISVRKISRTNTGDIIIYAYCFERKALRSFQANRIIQVVDLVTGEVLNAKQEIARIFNASENETAAGPKAQTSAVLKKCGDALNILIYMARCDGKFHYDEEGVVLNYLLDEHFECDFDNDYLLERIRNCYPDREAFFKSLDRIQSQDVKFKKLMRYAAQLVQADGQLVSEELNLTSELYNFTR